MHVLLCKIGNVEIMGDHMFILIEKSYKCYIGVHMLSINCIKYNLMGTDDVHNNWVKS
jgi:hypothetical protein